MYKSNYFKRATLRFKHFANKPYALFSSLGKVVLIGTLSVSTLTYAKASGLSTTRTASEGVAVYSENADSASHEESREVALDELRVLASRVPMSALQSPKIVSVISCDEIKQMSVQSVNDVLKLAVGVDVRQRGGFGVQTDISINGGTFDQITILLNGVPVNNPQTGHNAADFPVSTDEIERIEILEGSAARVYGGAAFSGAINVVTRTGAKNALSVNAQGGSFGTFDGGASVNIVTGELKNSVSGGYARSDGGTKNSDFSKGRAFYRGGFYSHHLKLDWQAGFSTQDYGASTFYSAKFDNQFESTSRIFTSVKGTIQNLPYGIEITPFVYWQKNYDHYQLTRGMEGAESGENYHTTSVFGASVDASVKWIAGTSSIGADVRREHILSTALGDLLPKEEWHPISGSTRFYDHEGVRTNSNIFIEHNFSFKGFSLSAGVLATANTGLDNKFRFYPGVDVSYSHDEHWKFFLSWNKSLRVPTYTDTYISNAVQQGDVNLKPEKISTFKAGANWKLQGVDVLISAFYSDGEDMIDWVYETEHSTKYHAMNIGQLDNMGVSMNVRVDFTHILKRPEFWIKSLKLGYAFIHQTHETVRSIYKSLYALEYLRHKFTAELNHRIFSRLSASWSLRWQRRMNGFAPYAKFDGKIMWSGDKYKVFVAADNITNHCYYDVGGVLQPGLWVMAGASFSLDF